MRLAEAPSTLHPCSRCSSALNAPDAASCRVSFAFKSPVKEFKSKVQSVDMLSCHVPLFCLFVLFLLNGQF